MYTLRKGSVDPDCIQIHTRCFGTRPALARIVLSGGGISFCSARKAPLLGFHDDLLN